MTSQLLRNLPSVERVVSSDALADVVFTYGRDWVVDLTRDAVADARRTILAGGDCGSLDQIAETVRRTIDDLVSPSPRPVINATGVVIHTNLGRAPLSKAAMAAADAVARGYSDLEIDLATGRRGSRQAHLQSLLQADHRSGSRAGSEQQRIRAVAGVVGAGSGTGSHSVAGRSGGNRRRLPHPRRAAAERVRVGRRGDDEPDLRADYADAVTDDTAAFLKAHASNFRVEGFTAAVDERELVELGERSGIPVLHDVGSGALLPTERYGLAHEPMPQEAIAAGTGLVFFSGDKLLGGPQAGIVVGKADLVQRLERHPLARAVRIDKMSLASLTATLTHYLSGTAESEVPVWRMIAASSGEIKGRAERWRSTIDGAPGFRIAVAPARSAIGGGSLPGETLDSWALSISSDGAGFSAESLLAALRSRSTPVIARIEDDAVRLDPRTVLPEQDDDTVRALAEALA